MWRISSQRSSLHENIHLELSECIQNFRDRREQLISLIMNTITLFEGVSEFLSSDIVQCFDIKSLMDLMEELGCKDKMSAVNDIDQIKKDNKIQNPGIAVLGQLKSGKSTFINNLIKKHVVPQAFDPCTARVTRISFSAKNYIEILDADRKILKKRHLKNSRIPEKYTKLNQKDRENPVEVKAGINVRFLKCGIDIVDTPGLNRNLLDLSKIIFKDVIPIVIYVIDGRKGVRQSDLADILELKNLIRDLEIIYFITYLDTDDPSEYGGSFDYQDIATMKMDAAFKKLQYHNFIPNSYEHWSQCQNFHGASLSCLIQHSRDKRTPETVYSFNLFTKFQMSFLKTISGYFENKIFEACEILLNFQMEISTKIMNYEQIFTIKNKECFDHIKLMKEIEGDMYLKIKYAISDSKEELINRLISRLEQESSAIIDPIKDTIYPSTIQIPENGIVDDPLIVDQCQIAIIKVLVQGLENVLKNFVEEELFRNYRNAVKENIFHSIKGNFLENGNSKLGRSPYEMILGRILNRKYKLERLSNTSPDNGQGIVIEFMNVILSSIKTFLSDGLINKLKENEVDVTNCEWKLQKAEEYLKNCDHHILAEEVCHSLVEDFEIKHNAFLKAMESETRLLERKIVDSENMRRAISEKMPDFLLLFLKTMNVKGKYLLNGGKKLENIGEGAESVVNKYSLKDEEFALKQIDLSIYKINNISEEVFYSQQLSHENLLPIISLTINKDESQIRILYPLKKMNLWHYMKCSMINSKNIFKMSLQIAEVLKYLHDHDLIHKDLKLTNILVDEHEDVAVTDYGFCKSEAIAKSYKVGPPIHIAPEIRLENFYTKHIDIYAFGITLWYLYVGTGKIPKNAIYMEEISQVVWQKNQFPSNTEIRPEKLKKFPDTIWKIMDNCWQLNPDDRPDIDTVISDLQRYSKLNLNN